MEQERKLRRDLLPTTFIELLIQIVFIIAILYVLAGMDKDKDDFAAQKQEYLGQIDVLEAEITRLEAKIAELEEENIDLKDEIQRLKEENIALRDEIQRLNDLITSQMVEIGKLKVRAGLPSCFDRDIVEEGAILFFMIPESGLVVAKPGPDYEKLVELFPSLELPVSPMNLKEITSFGKSIADKVKSEECKLRVRVLGLAEQYSIYLNKRQRLTRFFRVNQSLYGKRKELLEVKRIIISNLKI